MANKDQVYNAFKRQTGFHTKGSIGREGDLNLFYEGQVLFSFGRHFPMVVRCSSAAEISKDTPGFGCGIPYIINGDKYSVTTTRHQNEAIRTFKPNVQIPFSALQEAWNWTLTRELELDKLEAKREELYARTWGIEITLTRDELRQWEETSGYNTAGWKYSLGMVNSSFGVAQALSGRGNSEEMCNLEFALVDYCQDTWEYKLGKDAPWKSAGEMTPEDWQLWERRGREDTERPASDPPKEELQQRHFLGSVLFRLGNTCFLSSFDEIDKGNYFLCHIPGSPGTVSAAYENLKPKEVQLGLGMGMNILRQGDWFFIPWRGERPNKSTEVKAHRLGGKYGTHVVSRARKVRLDEGDEVLLAQGCVTHEPTDGRRAEHRRLKLGDGKTWWTPVKNLSEKGWSAQGRVD